MTRKQFHLKQVRLLDGLFKESQEIGKTYLLELDPDRLVAPCYEAIGIKPKKPRYGGWESMQISGHSVGHWLSATALMYAATGEQLLKDRLDYVVQELADLQEQHGGGYVSGFPEKPFLTVFSGNFQVENFSLANWWVPWYSIDKIFAGLIAAYLYGENQLALEVVCQLADWADRGLKNLDDAQFAKMLICEHGAMSENLALLYKHTKEPRYLELAKRFLHKAIVDPLATGRDQLTGLHANTQIPKLTGAAHLFEITGDEYYQKAALFFWETVTKQRSYVIGGNSASEHFPKLGTEPLHTRACETCNTYNMLKLTNILANWHGDANYMDYYERALYNHILASQDPETGLKMYFMSLKPGHLKVYGTFEDSFWCCTGTGMENPAKYGENIYAYNDQNLWVNLFIPSIVTWPEQGIVLEQRTSFPESEFTRLVFKEASGNNFTLNIRVPYWLAGNLVAKVNHQEEYVAQSPGWLKIERPWLAGDEVEIHLPMNLHLYRVPDDPYTVAILYGPIVLAGALGRENYPETDIVKEQTSLDNWPTAEVPVLITDQLDPNQWLKSITGKPLTFKTNLVGQPHDALLQPFYALHHQFQTVYWILATPAQWAEIQEERRQQEEKQRFIAQLTTDYLTPGEQQFEIEHNLQGEKSEAASWNGRPLRHAFDGGWFSYDLKVDPEQALDLMCTYWGGDFDREFDIFIDDQLIATQKLQNEHPHEFFTVTYPLDPALTQGKTKVTLKFQGKPHNIVGGIFEVRILRRIINEV